MSLKLNKDSNHRLTGISSVNNTKRVSKSTPKRVLTSQRVGNCSEKSCSTGVIKDGSGRPKKTTKSDVSFSAKYSGKTLDYCGRCGDTTTHNTEYQSIKRDNLTNNRNKANGNDIEITFKNNQVNKVTNANMKCKDNDKSNTVKQYYKNENFQSNDSFQNTEHDLRKMSLDTIKELPETHATSENVRTLVRDVVEIYSDTEEMGFFDGDDAENLESLKKFRQENYFECHSVKSRVDVKPNVNALSLTKHKCVYRFYLNDRLFPIPLSTDHNDNVRCVECHLPMDLKVDLDQSNKANGTIQAKVKLNSQNDAQDMFLFLPVKDSLIIKERRKQMKAEDDVVYFGVIKLDSFGNSVFNSTQPTDSLALKYQKGYRQFENSDAYKYKGVEKDDVIII